MGKKDGIKLSEKHGVNPTIVKCFFCGADKGVAMLGKLPGDAAAPKEAILDYEPCEKCQEMWDQGQVIIEAGEAAQDGRPPISFEGETPIYPTGRWLVMERESAQRFFKGVFDTDAPPGPACIDTEAFEHFFGGAMTGTKQ